MDVHPGYLNIRTRGELPTHGRRHGYHISGKYPVSEITIAGNLKDMWRNIVTVGNDIETRSNIQCGSVLLPEMKIAGQ